MNKIEIKVPKDWRKGQTLFNFLEWLNVKKEISPNQSYCLADTFHLSDEELEEYIKEYEKEITTKS